MPSLTVSDIVILPLAVVGWLSVLSYCVVWCGTRAYFKSRDRVIEDFIETSEDE